jgi:hypothetical protein
MVSLVFPAPFSAPTVFVMKVWLGVDASFVIASNIGLQAGSSALAETVPSAVIRKPAAAQSKRGLRVIIYTSMKVLLALRIAGKRRHGGPNRWRSDNDGFREWRGRRRFERYAHRVFLV